MLSSEFNAELGGLIRSLETRVRTHPNLIHEDKHDALDHLRETIIALIAVYISMRDD